MKYTNKVETIDGVIVAKIFVDGNRSIEQNFHPSNSPDVPWESEDEAQMWAELYTNFLEGEYQKQIESELKAEDDRLRLIRIEEMLTKLSNPSV
jgi:hypothetical protein